MNELTKRNTTNEGKFIHSSYIDLNICNYDSSLVFGGGGQIEKWIQIVLLLLAVYYYYKSIRNSSSLRDFILVFVSYENSGREEKRKGREESRVRKKI